jgi:hypothetical protein
MEITIACTRQSASYDPANVRRFKSAHDIDARLQALVGSFLQPNV